jgi:putative spermidine/putrescine transport system ATP-binding protein
VLLGAAMPGIAIPQGVTKASVSIRPEDVRLGRPGEGTIDGTVTFVRDLGATIETYIEAAGSTIIAVTTPRERVDVAAGDKVGVILPAESCVVVKS